MAGSTDNCFVHFAKRRKEQQEELYVQSADLAHMDVERTRKNLRALGVKRCRACSVEVFHKNSGCEVPVILWFKILSLL